MVVLSGLTQKCCLPAHHTSTSMQRLIFCWSSTLRGCHRWQPSPWKGGDQQSCLCETRLAEAYENPLAKLRSNPSNLNECHPHCPPPRPLQAASRKYSSLNSFLQEANFCKGDEKREAGHAHFISECKMGTYWSPSGCWARARAPWCCTHSKNPLLPLPQPLLECTC